MPTSRRTDPFRVIPGIGPSMAEDLRSLGYREVRDLARASPEGMYRRLCALTKTRQDPCVLYVFRSAVYFASRKRHQPELLLWWNWMDRTLSRAPGRPIRRLPATRKHPR